MHAYQNEWFSSSEIRERIWAISDGGQDNMFIIEGRDSALLIDTGWGIGNLVECIRSITEKPLTVVNTHGHLDHALGNEFFDEVFIGEKDIGLLDSNNIDTRRNYIVNQHNLREEADVGLSSLGGSLARKRTSSVADGYTFDLGNRTVTVHLTPGHTQGSLCLLDNKTNTFFTGDMYVPLQEWNAMWLHLPHSEPLQVSLNSVNKMVALCSNCTSMVSSHGLNYHLQPSRLKELLVGIEYILAKKVAGQPIHTIGGDGCLCVFENVGVVYNPTNLF